MIFTNFIIKMLGWLNPVWVRVGINPGQLKAILRAKLTMDGRRENTLHQKSNPKSNSLVMQTLVQLVVGIFMGTMLLAEIDTQISFLLYHAMLLVFFSMVIISEFSTILFDTKDNVEILPRPVNAKTFYASRIIHIIVYLLLMGVPLALGGIVISAVKFGVLNSLVLSILVLLDILIAVFFSNIFYMGIIRFFSAEKIKNIIMYVQIALAFGIYGSYQFLPKLFDSEIITEAQLGNDWWLYLIPPVWSAKVSNLFIIGNVDGIYLSFVLNLVFPLIGVLAIVKYFAPLYNQKLSEMEGAVENKKAPKLRIAGKSRSLIDYFKISKTEKAMYKLIKVVISKDRKFKQAIYTMTGYMLVLILMPVITEIGNLDGLLEKFANSKKYFALLIVPVILGLITLSQIQYSEHNDAIWIFKFAPIKNPGELLVSGIWIMVLNYFVPLALFCIVLVFFVWPVTIFPQVIMCLCVSLLFMTLFARLSAKYLPLSRPRSMANSSQNSGSVFLMLLMSAMLGGMLYGFSFLPFWSNYLLALVSFAGFLLVLRSIRKVKWNAIVQ